MHVCRYLRPEDSLRGGWESNSYSPLQEHQVFLTAELSSWPLLKCSSILLVIGLVLNILFHL